MLQPRTRMLESGIKRCVFRYMETLHSLLRELLLRHLLFLRRHILTPEEVFISFSTTNLDLQLDLKGAGQFIKQRVKQDDNISGIKKNPSCHNFQDPSALSLLVTVADVSHTFSSFW